MIRACLLLGAMLPVGAHSQVLRAELAPTNQTSGFYTFKHFTQEYSKGRPYANLVSRGFYLSVFLFACQSACLSTCLQFLVSDSLCAEYAPDERKYRQEIFKRNLKKIFNHNTAGIYVKPARMNTA